MPTPLETIVQRMIDAGESEDAIASVIQSYKPPPANPNPQKPGMMDTFTGGVLKSIGSGEMQKAMMEGGLGYLKGAALAIPKGVAGLASIGKGMLTDPGQTVSDIGTGLADMPGHMVNTFKHAGSDPMAWGEMMGEMTGAPVSAKVPGLAMKAVPPIARGAGTGLEAIGNAMSKYKPVTGLLPRIFDSRTLRMGEGLAGRGMSAVGKKLQDLTVPRVEGEIVPEVPPSGPMEGEVVPAGLLPESPVTQTGGWGKPAGMDRQLTSKVPFERDAATVGEGMNTPVDPVDNWAQTVLRSQMNPAPENIFNMPSEMPTPIKGLLPPARTPDNMLMELMKGLESEPGTSASRLPPVDEVLSGGGGGNVDNEMFDLVQRMSGRPTPKPRALDVTDVDNEIQKLLQQLEGRKNPISQVNRPIKGNVKPLVEPEWQESDFSISPQEADDLLANNASGESAASQEAMNRIASMKQKGESFVVYDKAGNVKPLIGPDAVDYVAKKGETYGVRSPEGFKVLDDKGGKVPSKKPTPPSSQPGSTYTVPKEHITLDIIKGAGSKGFKFVGLDSKGNYRFVKIQKK